MNKAVERLIALDGSRASVSIIRAKNQAGGAGVIRNGTLALVLTPDEVRATVAAGQEEPLAVIVDATGLPLVAVMGNDTFSLHGDIISVAFRATFRVDILARPFPRSLVADYEPMTYERAARELAAELEAGLRSMLLVRPDPDPSAGVPRHGVPATASAPLRDNSVRFAVGHLAATLFPDDGGIRLMCVQSEVKPTWQRVHLRVPITGEQFALEADDIEQLGAYIRAFLCGHHVDFIDAAVQNAPAEPEAPDVMDALLDDLKSL